tara:strand:+ start:908 stop:5701 length:4794 start_codon:yes stop_codon:yes gene_type:complete
LAVKYVEDVGWVELSGELPTEEEAAKLRALRDGEAVTASQALPEEAPVVPPSVQEALSPLTQLQEGFAGSRDYRTERSLPEQAVRGLGSSALGLIRGAPELLAAGSEAAAGAAMDEPIAPARLFGGSPVESLIEIMRPRARQAAEDVEKTEREMYTASEPVPGEAWDAVLDDPSRLGRFIVEGIAGSAPHYLATLASPAGYAAALVGDIAKERARQRGDNKISGEDLTVAIPSAAAISGLNRAAQLLGLGGPAGQGIITAGIRNALAETVTEIPQSVIEVVGRQAGARPGGVSGEDVKQAVIGAATVAPVFGGVAGAAGRMGRATPEAEAVRQDEPTGEMTLGPVVEEIAPIDWDEVTPEAPAEVVTEEVVTPTEEVVVIEGVLDEDGEIDEVTAKALDKIASDRGLGITRDRDYATVARDAGGDVVGGTYTSFDGDNYTFDVVVSEGAEGKGIASRLLDDAVQGFYEYQDINPDATMLLDVINPVMRRALERRGFKVTEAVDNDGRVIMEPADYDSIGGAVAAAIAERLSDRPTPTTEVVAEEVVAEPASQDAPPADAVDAVIESIDKSTAPGEYTQVAPPPLPLEAGPAVDAVDVMMETVGVIEGIDKLKSRVKAEGKAAREDVPKRPGAKETKRKPTRAENQVAEAEGRARATLAAADVAAQDSDVDDALADAVAAQARTLAGPSEFISAKNEDVEKLLLDMGRSEEAVKAFSETQRVSYAQSLAMLEEANLRSRLEGDGPALEVVIPPEMTALANSINQRPRAASDVEQLALASVIAQVNTANRRLSARINELDQIVPESSVEKSVIQDEIDILTKKKGDLDATFDLFASANKVVGSMWGRAGWMRQRRINDNMTLDEAQGAARSKKGAPLTPKQRELLTSIFNDADALREVATKARKSALSDYNKAKRSLEKAQGVKESADDVRKAARKKVEEAIDKRSPRQKAAEEEVRWGVDKPIRVTPLRMSAEEKAARKAFRDAEKKAKQAAKEVAKKEKEVQEIKGMVAQAEAEIRRAKQKKAAAPEEAIQHPFFRLWTKQKSIARAMTSSGDDSALGRQGGALVLQNLGAAIRTLPYIVRVNPFKWDPVARRVVHNPASRAAAIEIQEEMLNSPWQTARNWAGLEMSEVEGRTNTDRTGLDAKEEYFATHAFDEGGKLLQGAGKYLITPSQNLFALTLNRLRSVNFDDGLRILAEGEGADIDAVTPEAGDAVITAMIEANAPPSKPRRLREGSEDLFLTKEDIPNLTPEERAEFGRIDLAMNVVPRADAEALAVIINASSGRGEWTFGASDHKGADVVNKVLRNILFAPKFTASRLETFSHPFQLIAASRGHGRFKNVSPKALKLFKKKVGKSIGLGVSLGAMSVIAASFDDDRDPGEALDNFMNPGSADFMKGRVGNHRFDALGGIPSTIRYLLPLNFTPIEAWRKSDDPAEWAYHTLISDWGEGAGDKFSRMVRNKLDPLTSAAVTILTQKDFLGRPLREQDFMGMSASEMNDVEGFIINGLIRPVLGAYSPIMAQSAATAAIRTMYPHIGEEDRNAFVHQFAPLLWEVMGGGHADYQDAEGSRGYKAKSRRAPKVKRARKRRQSLRKTNKYSR